MADERKASDVLVDLEKEVKSLHAFVKLQDLLLKRTLDACNQTNAMIKLMGQDPQLLTPQHQTSNPEALSIPGGFPIEVDRNPKGQRRNIAPPPPSTKASNEDIEFKDYLKQRQKPAVQEEFDPRREPIKMPEMKQEKKVPVSQRVQDNNGKDLFMAEVSVFSQSGELATKCKTNAMGKWQAQLPAGKYSITITKTDTATKKKLEQKQDINIPNVSSTVNLPTLIVNRS